jgi:hypothetical protein
MHAWTNVRREPLVRKPRTCHNCLSWACLDRRTTYRNRICLSVMCRRRPQGRMQMKRTGSLVRQLRLTDVWLQLHTSSNRNHECFVWVYFKVISGHPQVRVCDSVDKTLCSVKLRELLRLEFWYRPVFHWCSNVVCKPLAAIMSNPAAA